MHASLLLPLVQSAFDTPLWNSQADLRCIKLGPPSSYSALESHICWKDPSDARIDPPAHGTAFTKVIYHSIVSSVSMATGTYRHHQVFTCFCHLSLLGNCFNKGSYQSRC